MQLSPAMEESCSLSACPTSTSRTVIVNHDITGSSAPHAWSPATTMSPSPSLAAKIEQWLKQFGFTYNPFQATNSERDRNLEEHFIEYTDFDSLLDLRSKIYFARIGDGKTATRLRVQSYYRDTAADHGVFAFSYLIPSQLAQSSAYSFEEHWDTLLEAAVRHAFAFLAMRGIDFAPLRDGTLPPTLLQKLSAYFTHYYGLREAWRLDLHQAMEDLSFKQMIGNLAPIYDDLGNEGTTDALNIVWLRQWVNALDAARNEEPHVLPKELSERWMEFRHLLTEIGIQHILILVDGIDVKPLPAGMLQPLFEHDQEREIAERIDRMTGLVQPLVHAALNEKLGAQTTWHLFLPNELFMPLSEDLSKEVEHIILSWNNARLQNLIHARLRAASNGAVTTLLQIAEDDVPGDLEEFASIESRWSPRYLIHFINKLFEVHLSRALPDELPGKLSCDTLKKAGNFSYQGP